MTRLFAVLALLGCTGSPPGITAGLPAPDVDARVRMDEQGGVASITNPNSPLYGASVIVPPGALSEPTTIRLREGRLPDTSSRAGVGAVLELLPDGTEFLEPVTVLLPVPETTPVDALEARVWNEDAQSWDSVLASTGRYLLPDAEREGEIEFQTDHFSRYRAVFRNTRTLGLRAASGTPQVRIRARGFVDDSGVIAIEEAAFPRRIGAERITRDLPPGNYVIEADFGSGPRCARADLTTGDVELTLEPSMSSCDAPTPQLRAEPLRVKVGEDVALSGAIASAGSVDWFLNLSRGGQLIAGGRSGTTRGETLEWTFRPTSIGRHIIYLTAYEAGAGPTAIFGEANVVVEVTASNRPPRINALTADREVLGPGPHDLSMGALMSVTATEEPPGDPARTPGATVLTVDAEDPDGDMLTVTWDHALPGNFYAYTPPTNALLGRSAGGQVVLPTSGAPYEGTSVVYLAPDCDFVVGNDFMTGSQPNFPLGFYVKVRALVTDEASNPNRPRLARSWLHLRVVPPSLRARRDGPTCGRGGNGRRVAGSCGGSRLCTNHFAEGATTQDNCTASGGVWSTSRCDESTAVGACEIGNLEVVYYPPSFDVESAEINCRSDLGDWRPISSSAPATGYYLVQVTNFPRDKGYWAVRHEDTLDPPPALSSLACGGTTATPWEFRRIAGPFATAEEAALELCPRVRGFFLRPLAPPECGEMYLDGMNPDTDAVGRDRILRDVCEPML
ncbi:MAG: hypothetical protein AAGE52_00640 [Myxococcota bacterium]